MVRLNCGCGNKKKQGYINIDCRTECNPDIVGRVQDLYYAPDSIDEIYASHILEHNDLQDIHQILRLFYNWLKPNGHLYIGVPNLTILGEIFARGEEEDIIYNWVFGRFDISPVHGHKWGFTEKSLQKELKQVGFEVTGYFPPLDDDTGFVYNGQLLSLNLECEKR